LQPDAADLAKTICPNTPLDLGIVRVVATLRDAGIRTYESCEGGDGHSFRRPTVKLYGSQGEGWRALALCMDYGYPVLRFERTWDMEDGEPSGPYWTITFRQKIV
jgi:hypothetical protein